MVANTAESIEYVERSKESAMPSANDLLSKWADMGDDSQFKPNNMMCSVGALSDPVLTDLKSFIATNDWFQRFERQFVDNACGDSDADDGSSFGPTEQQTLTVEHSESGPTNETTGTFDETRRTLATF
jgi:hypothetical protein